VSDRPPDEPTLPADVLRHLDHLQAAAPELGELVEVLRAALLSEQQRSAQRERALRFERDTYRARLTRALHGLVSGGAFLPRLPGRAAVGHDVLAQTYRQLKVQDFLNLAQALHQSSGQGSPLAYQIFLVREVLVTGGELLAERLVRRALPGVGPTDEAGMRAAVGQFVLQKVCQSLEQKSGTKAPPEMAEHLRGVIDRSLGFVADLLTANPPGWLLLPNVGCAFDPNLHEAPYGRPASGDLEVTALLFPGYVVRRNPEQVVEKATVYTDRVQGRGAAGTAAEL
jgi:hypothetical protein